MRVESGGILFSEMDLGDHVATGDVLGIVTDPITNHSTELVSPVNGNIIGMAINQVVIPGFAAYHIGIESTQEAMIHVENLQIPSDVNTDSEVIDPE
jgi:predicted deacylase